MAMTKRDLQALAYSINTSLLSGGDVIDGLCIGLGLCNPRFDKANFLAACLKDWSPPPTEIVVGSKVRALTSGCMHASGEVGVVVEVDEEDAEVPYRVEWGAGMCWECAEELEAVT